MFCVLMKMICRLFSKYLEGVRKWDQQVMASFLDKLF